MRSETNNAPREVWVTLTDRGELIQVWEMEDAARHPVLRYGVERYLRADLVVPTVDEIAQRLAERRGLGRPLGSDLADAADLHAWLLSRIEGDTDEQ